MSWNSSVIPNSATRAVTSGSMMIGIVATELIDSANNRTCKSAGINNSIIPGHGKSSRMIAFPGVFNRNQPRRCSPAVVMASVDSKIVEPVAFGETIHPVLFGDLRAGIILRGAGLQRFQLGQRGAADGGVFGAMLGDQLLK